MTVKATFAQHLLLRAKMMITFTNKKKIAYNYSDPGGTLEKLNNLKPLFSRNEELNISKEAKENALASEGKSYTDQTQ